MKSKELKQLKGCKIVNAYQDQDNNIILELTQNAEKLSLTIIPATDKYFTLQEVIETHKSQRQHEAIMELSKITDKKPTPPLYFYIDRGL